MAIDATFDFAMTLVPAANEAANDRIGVENTRLQRVIESLPDPRYARAVVIGASAAVSRKLSRYCETIATGLDTSRLAPGRTELLVLCDALADADKATLIRMADQCVNALQPGGHIMLVHWLDADDAAAAFISAAGENLLPISRQRTPHYRVDVLERA